MHLRRFMQKLLLPAPAPEKVLLQAVHLQNRLLSKEKKPHRPAKMW